ncbi:dTDP-4-amino-4,6-dideoxygalactose transaminase [Desulfomicrobium norvegicum]|uniref:dTDP-4-amino-4,6-dideoxygalactose transaminase n=1 Tax=Desulfomicrobium norvegicum (strain DSM 1741 / NCIMB 8310) TaxID=52561 RepID=A0A8G2C597_DESNO|nr:DegT/DnrJ/EryC1/StrS family aminotransferase [Desulfomicrobium norvegicum]SFM08230.1 dTDP-4-amino-4,6-dideoxygalactose transaminase [Desulfomicrobium norvegicum]
MKSNTIPFLNLISQNAPFKDEILAVWMEILESAAFIGGPHVSTFEAAFAAACQTSHCVGVGSGTDALRLIFLALGLAPGDEVITVPNTFIATSEAISQAGGRPVFVDVRPDTLTMDPQLLEVAITPATRGIVPVHLYGQPCCMDAICAVAARHNLWVVEDACQAHLASYGGRMTGSLATAAAFSFYPGKNLGACGEAGAVTTNSPKLAETVRCLRDHGQSKKYVHLAEGYNGRLDALQAAALYIKLPHLAAWNASRRAVAARYDVELAGLPGLRLVNRLADRVSALHLYVVMHAMRDELLAHLASRGIGAAMHYPIALHMQKAYSHLNYRKGDFPVAEAACASLLSLPMHPYLCDDEASRIVAAVKEFCLGHLG